MTLKQLTPELETQIPKELQQIRQFYFKENPTPKEEKKCPNTATK